MEGKKKKVIQPEEAIALPPLKMVLVHAKDDRLNKAALQQPVSKKASVTSINQEEQVKAQSLIKIIEHLEKKP
jgi:hypothetical protein